MVVLTVKLVGGVTMFWWSLATYSIQLNYFKSLPSHLKLTNTGPEMMDLRPNHGFRPNVSNFAYVTKHSDQSLGLVNIDLVAVWYL